jgi:flagellar hook-length control protein FliK
MIKPPDIAGINPAARIIPVLAVDNIGSIAQELGDRATQFAKGQEYIGHVLSKAGDSVYHVKLEAEGFKGAVLKMELGAQAQLGQTLSLKFLHSEPNPTFLLAPPSVASSSSVTSADISSAAHLIGQYLTKAENEGVSTRYQANAIVSQTPFNPQQLAYDLKYAVTKSGLFYESHLSDLVQSGQNLSPVKVEPQNQSNSSIAALVSQQLAVLENQRMSWQGEVWPGQKMSWDVQLERRDVLDEEARQALGKTKSENIEAVASELNLELPRLGKVAVKLNLAEGRLRVQLSAEQTHALDVFNQSRLALAEAIAKNGQQLDALTVTKHD